MKEQTEAWCIFMVFIIRTRALHALVLQIVNFYVTHCESLSITPCMNCTFPSMSTISVTGVRVARVGVGCVGGGNRGVKMCMKVSFCNYFH